MTGSSLSIRGPVRLGILALTVLILGFGLWATLARLEGALIVSGQVIVDQNRRVLQHPEGGAVDTLFVHEGSVVAADAPLLRLSAAELLGQFRINRSHLAGLEARAARLAAERDGLDRLAFPASLLSLAAADPTVRIELEGQAQAFDLNLALLQGAEDLLRQRIDQSREEIQALATERQTLTDQLALIDQDLAAKQGLFDKGLLSKTQLLALQGEGTRLSGQIAAIDVATTQAQGAMTEAGLRIDGLRMDRASRAAAELAEIEPRMTELRTGLGDLARRIASRLIRAPEAGVVMGLQVQGPDSVVEPAQPILSLVPLGRPLIISARLRPEDIDGVFPGQPAELLLTAFAPGTAPRLKGEVTQIAADAVTDPQTGAAFYQIELAFAPGEVDALGDRPIRPGMRVEAFLATGSQSPMAYLLDPVLRFFSRSLRDG